MVSRRYRKPVRIVNLILAILLILCACWASMSCSRAPSADDLRDEVKRLVEASYEINAVFYGAGLPVLDRDSDLYRDFYAYYAPATAKDYDIVSPHAKFSRIEEIKDAAKRVFSSSWCDEVLFVSAFSGIRSDLGGSALISEPRFLEDNDYLYQSVRSTDYLSAHGEKIYDYSTLRVVSPSNATTVTVKMTAWYVSEPSDPFTATLRLVLTADGWRLDSPTY